MDTRDALVVYDTLYGNTLAIAEAIKAALGERYHVTVQPVTEVREIPEAIDLLVVGGPTQRHGAGPGMEPFLEGIPRDALLGVPAAAFDTRYEGAGWLTGSAATHIAHALKRAGAHMVAPPESFFVEKDVPPEGERRRHEMESLEPGEVERAAEWARRLLEVTLGVAAVR